MVRRAVDFGYLDKLLQIGNISVSTWDNLRTLGELSSLRFVTGSSKRLRDLIGSPEISISQFWNLFGPTPLSLGAFSDQELMDFLLPFHDQGVTFEPDAVTAFHDYTGGIPILASALCLRVADLVSSGDVVSRESLLNMTNEMVTSNADILSEIWKDYRSEHAVIERLARKKVDLASIPRAIVERITSGGLVCETSGKVCGIIQEYLGYEAPQSIELEDLFADPEVYERNFQKVLELRLAQLSSVDSTLTKYLRMAVENLDDPKVFGAQLRNLAKHPLELIWKNELPDGRIPVDWTNGWKNTDRLNGNPERNPPEGQIPVSAKQLYLLNLMTDARKAGQTRVSRTTYLLLNQVYSAGDFAAHLDDNNLVDGRSYEVLPEFARAICLTAIELCSLLDRDLRQPNIAQTA